MSRRIETSIITSGQGTTIIERHLDTHGNEIHRQQHNRYSVFPESIIPSTTIIPNSWLQNVIPAMTNEEIREAFGFSLPEEIVHMLTNSFGQYQEEQVEEKQVLTKKEFEQLPSRRYSKKKNINRFQSKECSICQQTFKSRQKLIKLSCDHEFHCKCIGTWLMKHRATCPLCQRKI